MLILFLLTCVYAFLLLFLTLGMILLKSPNTVTDFQNISVIVAARNEEKNLPELLQRLATQNYPTQNFEIIIANDRSTDRTSEVVLSFTKECSNIKLVEIISEQADLIGKKNALNMAINIAKYEILAFTDADCLPSENWLTEINRHFRGDVDYLMGHSPLILNSPVW